MQLDKLLPQGWLKAGVTVHYVDEGMDTGPIIDQQAVVLDERETKESLQEKIHDC